MPLQQIILLDTVRVLIPLFSKHSHHHHHHYHNDDDSKVNKVVGEGVTCRLPER